MIRFFVILFVFNSNFVFSSVPSLKSKSEVERLIRNEEKKLSQIKEKEVSILKQIEELQKEIFANDARLVKTKFSTKSTTKEINGLKKELEETESVIKKQEKQFTIVVNTVNRLYGKNSIYFLESVFNSGNFNNLNRNLKLSEIFIRTYFDLYKSLYEANSVRKRKILEISQSSDKLSDLESEQSKILKNIKAKKRELIVLLKKTESEKILHLKLLEELKVAESNLDSAISDLNDEKVRLIGLDKKRDVLPFPLEGKIIQRYGRQINSRFKTIHFNKGITIASSQSNEIKAVHEGLIVYSNWFKGYGNLIIISHGNNYYSLYAKAEKILLKKGSHVKKNDVIALASRDQSDNYSLYFELRHKKRTLNPLAWLKE